MREALVFHVICKDPYFQVKEIYSNHSIHSVVICTKTGKILIKESKSLYFDVELVDRIRAAEILRKNGLEYTLVRGSYVHIDKFPPSTLSALKGIRYGWRCDFAKRCNICGKSYHKLSFSSVKSRGQQC